MVPELSLAKIREAPLDVAMHLAAVEDPAAGAVATFIGKVRDHDPEVDGIVQFLEYEAHPDAEAFLIDIAQRVMGDHPVRVAVSHRIGRLEVGDLAVVVAVSSPHRALAFDVCRDVIETIKADLPIWKRQTDTTGEASWKGIS
jgi:molybdopterin synthase catalytic subunit